MTPHVDELGSLGDRIDHVGGDHHLSGGYAEGQLVRFLKLGLHGYTDAFNRGLEDCVGNPSRSIWVSRFYDEDHLTNNIRDIDKHAAELQHLICETIPARFKECGVSTAGYKVILLAHSMGGLVCRKLIQTMLDGDPKRWIHRFVTMGSPHGGIELGAIPDILEAATAAWVNPWNSGIFSEPKMREYLKLDAKKKNSKEHLYDVHSLAETFPVKRCLCVIGSDYKSYSAVQHATGAFSDGLVKQNHAYVVGGKAPAKGSEYPCEQKPFWANVHRAHSGRRGIVNSYETFENIHRFLFGDTMAEISLENMAFPEQGDDVSGFYDIEFLLSVRGTGVYLHRREQDPCENAIRLDAKKLPKDQYLHTLFLNSNLRSEDEPYSHFTLTLRVVERLVKEGFLWDREYPARPIYNETIEIRLGDFDRKRVGTEVQYRWLSDGPEWTDCTPEDGSFRLPLRAAGSFAGEFVVTYRKWPDPQLTEDR